MYELYIKQRFKIAIGLTGAIFILESVGSYITNSLALASDAVHVFMDLFSLTLSLLAIYLSNLPPTEKKTYGWHRFEVFASFINGLLLLAISMFIFYKAFQRFLAPPHVKAAAVLIVATAGLMINLFVAYWLMDIARKDLNIKSALFHVLGDAIASIGVIISAGMIYLTGLFIFDSVISFFIGLIIIAGAVRIVLESSHILLEGVPRDIDLEKVVGDVRRIDGVRGLHSVHIWSLCSNSYAFSAHIDVDVTAQNGQGEILNKINELLASRYNIHYTTLQMECMSCAHDLLLRKIKHHNRKT